MSTLALPAPPSPWRQVLPALALALLAVLLLYRDTAASMVSIWARSQTFAHAWAVPPIVAWLVWRQREELAALSPQPAPRMLLPMALAAAAWLIGDLASANAVTQLAFTALLVLSVLAVLGMDVGRVLAFPLGFLFFAVPIGDFMVPLLMAWTADFTVAALRLSGIPVFREGQQFVIPSGNWSVIEACSGVRYLMASLMVGVLFAYLNYRSLKRRLLFSLVALVLPVVANWVRAYLIVMLGHLSDNRLAAGVDHLIYGWVFFGVVVMLMFMIGMRWSEPPAAHGAAPPAGAAARAVFAASGVAWTVAAASAALAVWPHAALWAFDRGDRPGTPQLAAPSPAPGWTASEQPVSDWTPAFQQPMAELRRSFRRGDAEVGLYVGYYRRQHYHRKLVAGDNALVRSDDPRWAQVDSAARALDLGGRTLDWRSAVLRGSAVPGRSGAERLLVWRSYWVNGTWTASDAGARAVGARERLLGRGDDAAVVIVYARQDDAGDAQAQAQVEAFLHDHLARLEAQLGHARDTAH